MTRFENLDASLNIQETLETAEKNRTREVLAKQRVEYELFIQRIFLIFFEYYQNILKPRIPSRLQVNEEVPPTGNSHHLTRFRYEWLVRPINRKGTYGHFSNDWSFNPDTILSLSVELGTPSYKPQELILTPSVTLEVWGTAAKNTLPESELIRYGFGNSWYVDNIICYLKLNKLSQNEEIESAMVTALTSLTPHIMNYPNIWR